MKKLSATLFILAFATSSVFAATSFGTSVKNAVKADVKNTTNAVKSAAKADIQNAAAKQTNTAALKKAEKMKQIDSKLAELNKQADAVKKDKNLTETERTLKAKALQKQIDFYNKQKAALQ